jgi:hypothetical protein
VLLGLCLLPEASAQPATHKRLQTLGQSIIFGWAKSDASLRDFHDRLLCYGSTPISVIGPELLADLAKPLAEVRASAAY